MFTTRFLLSIFAVTWHPTVVTSTDIENLPKVFITVSSLATIQHPKIITERRIQLNWYNAQPADHDWIGLFDHDVETGDISSPFAVHQINSHQGVHTTSSSMPRQVFVGELKRRCLGFWVAYVRNDTSIASNCIKIEPNWMHENQQIIGNFALTELFIPGTHDAGSHQPYRGWPDENPITKYKITQDEDLWAQFVYGIRHVDLRIGYYAETDEFYIIHGPLRVNPFLPELTNIRKFLDSTKEFLILDFHEFGFEENRLDRHVKFLTLLKSLLGPFIIPVTRGKRVTLNELWKSNQRVLLMYNDKFHTESDLLWPGVYQAWANANKLQELKDYFTNLFKTPKFPSSWNVWSAQAELTANSFYILTHPFDGVRLFADMVNLNVTYWFRDLWWDKANCVATDFFLGNNIIEIAINSNKKRRDLKVMVIVVFVLLSLISNGDTCLKTISRVNRLASNFQPMYDSFDRDKGTSLPQKPKFIIPQVLKGCRQRTTDSARVFLTVSSLPTEHGFSDRRLEFNWYNIMPRKGDWIGLFTTDPCINNTAQPIEFIQVIDYPEDSYMTNIHFPHQHFDKFNLTSICLGFWIAYVRNDLVLDSDCKKSQPHWMWENRKSIQHLTLSQLMIPGTHLSGSYKMNITGSETLDSLIGPFETTQDETLWNQLVYGNRYLEIAVALHARTKEHWIQFDEFLANPLIPALNEIRNFIESTNEIIIIDIHSFLKGFSFHNVSVSRRHRMLVQKLIDILQPYLIPKSMGINVTLKDLWADNKRIYISYNDENHVHDQHLWPGIPHFLVETVKVEMLVTYFERFSPTVNKRLWTAQAHLTPTDAFKITKANSSLRHLAHESNHYFTEWFRDFWWDKSNIIATDFFHGNNLIDVAIEANQERDATHE
uniref:Phosphatidylinositol-specific phospholipase C X domain-containing protein n=1 Tax=Strigamia maritima TaxID=126957 RepID=T1JAD6_STRMM